MWKHIRQSVLHDAMPEMSGDSFEVRNELIKRQCEGCESLVLFHYSLNHYVSHRLLS